MTYKKIEINNEHIHIQNLHTFANDYSTLAPLHNATCTDCHYTHISNRCLLLFITMCM